MDRKSPKDSKKTEDVSKGPRYLFPVFYVIFRLNTGSISGHRSNGNAPKPKIVSPPMDHVPPMPPPVVYPVRKS